MDPHSLFKFVETCENCLANRSTGRPSMADVIADLEYALQLQVSAEAGSRVGDAMSLEVDSNKDSMAWWYQSTSSSGSS